MWHLRGFHDSYFYLLSNHDTLHIITMNINLLRTDDRKSLLSLFSHVIQEAYSEPCQTSKDELFANIVNDFNLINATGDIFHYAFHTFKQKWPIIHIKSRYQCSMVVQMVQNSVSFNCICSTLSYLYSVLSYYFQCQFYLDLVSFDLYVQSQLVYI